MKLEEKTLNKNRIYKGRVINFNLDEIELPNGEKATREFVEHPGGVAILAIKDGFVYLVRQFRYPLHKEIIEIPAGKLDKNEDVLKAAEREFKEEIGAVNASLIELGSIYPSVGYTNEIIHLFYSDTFSLENQSLDSDEFLNVIKMPLKEFEQKITNNEIKDAKTIASYNLFLLKIYR